MISKLYTPSSAGSVKCDLCLCREVIPSGGYCRSGTRRNLNGELIDLSYGRIISIHTANWSDYFEGTYMATFNIEMLGSNIKLRFDQDYDISLHMKEIIASHGRDFAQQHINTLGAYYSTENLVTEIEALGADSVIFSTGEPLVNIEYLADLSKQLDIPVGIISNGYVTPTVRKIVRDDQYQLALNIFFLTKAESIKYCGYDVDTLIESLSEFGCTTINYGVISGYNDNSTNLNKLIRVIVNSHIDRVNIFSVEASYRMPELDAPTIQHLSNLTKLLRKETNKNVQIIGKQL